VGVVTTQSSHKVSEDALLALFASSARVSILKPLLLDPRRAYYQRQLEAATGLPIRAVQRELDRLTSAGLLYRREEGNRAYYQTDMDFPLFPELRAMVLKSCNHADRLRGVLGMDDCIRLLFLHEATERVLVVVQAGRRAALDCPGPYSVEVMASDEFIRALSEDRPLLDSYLREGVDLLGRREDLIWRRIEAAGYDVVKGEGVP
jgi:DNA-binding transcriptional ArsR family regulator